MDIPVEGSVDNPTRPLMYEVMRRATERLVPLQVAIELTYRCNLRCKHCYVDPSLRQNLSDELSTLEWYGVLDQLAAAGTLSLLFTGGEIFTRPGFFNIAFAARERGFQLMLLTNGTLVDAAAIANLKVLKPYQIGLSLYGATEKTHEAVTGYPGSFAATTNAIARLAESGLRVTVQATLMRENVHEASAIQRLAGRLGAQVLVDYQLTPTKNCSLTPQRLEASFAPIVRYLARDPVLGTAEPVAGGPTTCQAGKGICSISPLGDVFPCLMMPLRLGNLRQRKFQDLWRQHPSEALDYLRSLSTEDLEGCAECVNAPFCQRCSGVALSETGSLTACPPSARRYAAIRARIHHERLHHEKGGETLGEICPEFVEGEVRETAHGCGVR